MQNARLKLALATRRVKQKLLVDRFWTSLTLVFVMLSLTKSRSFIPYGRFWAEEGAYFFPAICVSNSSDGLLFLFNNHLQLWTNVGVLISTLVPLGTAPIIANLYAILVQAIPLVLLAAKRKALGLENAAVFIIALAYFGMPQAAEVWANTINLHFHFLIIAGIILALPAGGRSWFLFSFFLLLASGLSGIPANFLAPLFLIAAFYEKSIYRYIQAAAICATAAFQIVVLFQSGYQGERGLVPPLDIIALSAITQSFYSLYFGVSGGNFVAGFLRPLLDPSQDIRAFLGICLLVVTFVLLLKLYRLPVSMNPTNIDGWRRLKLLLAAVFSLVASITLALDEGQYLIHAWVGGRYFFAPNIFFLTVLLAAPARKTLVQKTAIVCVVVFSFAGIPGGFDGPKWNDVLVQVRDAGEDDLFALNLPIWPDGTWQMTIEPICWR